MIMASNVALLFVLISSAVPAAYANTNANAAANAGASADTGNPIRKVVQMLQMMSKKVEEEGKKEKELFDKFVCYCKNGASTLGQSIADNNAKVPQLQSDIEAAEQQLE